MCGIVGAVAQRDVNRNLSRRSSPPRIRGYDSSGVAVVDTESGLTRVRRLGKAQELAGAVEQQHVIGGTGIAHTR